jgi:hypothetical protein
MPARSMPPSLAAGPRRLRWEQAPFRIDVVCSQFSAMFEDVPQTGQDRLVSATGRLVDALPIARARSPRKAANEASCEDTACQVSLRRVTRNALREIASDRGDRRSRDVRVGAGSKDLSDDHWQPPSLVAVLHLMTIEFVLNMSLLKKIF